MNRRLGGRELRRNAVGSLCAAAFVAIAFGVASLLDSQLLVASVGASAFIAFLFPHANSARPRFLVGGYLCGCLWGGVCALARLHLFLEAGPIAAVFLCALAVLLTAFSMSVLDLEHPPAAALAVSISLSARPLAMAAVALATILALCLCKHLVFRRAEESQPDQSTNQKPKNHTPSPKN